MKFERTSNERGGELVRFAGHVHDLPALPEGMENDAAVAWVESGYRLLGDTIDKVDEIKANQRLSDIGRGELIEPLLGEAHESVAKLSASLDMYESEIGQLDSQLTSAPDLHPHAAVLGQREVEIRQWFRGMDRLERIALLDRIARDEVPKEIAYALKRTPIALPPDEQEVFDRGWRESCRRSNPELAVEIESKRAALDRARRATALIGVTTMAVSQWDKRKVLQRLISSDNDMLKKSKTLHGFDEFEVAQARRLKALRDNDKIFGRA